MLKVKKNRLRITCPELTNSFGEVLLNGKPLHHIKSLRIDIPESADSPFIMVTAKFLASVDLDVNVRLIKRTNRRLNLSSELIVVTFSSQASQPRCGEK